MRSFIKKRTKKLWERYQLSKLAITSLSKAFINRNLFQDIEKYCMFIGYPRSVHSLVGALIDAHPNIIIGHEVDALKYLEAGFNYLQIYYLLLNNSQFFITREKSIIPVEKLFKGRFKYIIPNQWNGKFTKLKIIGDKYGSASTKRLRNNIKLLKALDNQVKVPVKIIHLVRNPFDNISTIYIKSPSKTLEQSIDYYFSLCYANESIIKQINSNKILLLKAEDIIAEPKIKLKEVIEEFLGLEAYDDYLEDCSSIIFDSPRKTRNKVPWNEQLIEVTQRKIDQVSFLQGYNYYN